MGQREAKSQYQSGPHSPLNRETETDTDKQIDEETKDRHRDTQRYTDTQTQSTLVAVTKPREKCWLLCCWGAIPEGCLATPHQHQPAHPNPSGLITSSYPRPTGPILPLSYYLLPELSLWPQS